MVYDKNFEIAANGKAYTEDNVLIYNIFISFYLKKITDAQIREYFIKFGPIKSMRLVKRSINFKSGYINFVDPNAASKVLQHNKHYINAVRIQVRACDSWHQPNADSAVSAFKFRNYAKKNFNNNDEDTTSTSAATKAEPKNCFILNLNDDCLEQICKFLNINDQINFGRTCRRFKDVFVMFSRIEHKTLNLYKFHIITLWQIRQLLQMAGHHVEAILGMVPEKDGKRIIEFMGQYCENVKVIKIFSTRLGTDLLSRFLYKFTKLVELDLNSSSLDDSSIHVIKKFGKLEKLKIDENDGITGKYISQLKNIKELSVAGCRRLQSRHFQDICQKLTNLTLLDIKFCSQLKTKDYEEMVTSLHNLETLKFTCGFGNQKYECVSKLPKLKQLEIYGYDSYSPIREELFTELIQYKSEQLECLKLLPYNCLFIKRVQKLAELKNLKELVCPNNRELDDKCLEQLSALSNLEVINLKSCKNFSTKGLLELLKNCLKLKCIDITHCKSISDEFVLKSCQILQEQHNKQLRKDCVELMAFQSSIHAMFVKLRPEVVECNHLLKIYLDMTSFNFDVIEDEFDASDDSDVDDDDYLGYDGMDDDYFMYFSSSDDDDNDRHAFYMMGLMGAVFDDML